MRHSDTRASALWGRGDRTLRRVLTLTVVFVALALPPTASSANWTGVDATSANWTSANWTS